MKARIKKYLPLIVGVLVVLSVVIVLVIRGIKSSKVSDRDEESNVPVLTEDQWPAISLTPTDKSDVPGSLGHWLSFRVEKINVEGASSMDYLLVYNTSDGGQQGVPGTIQLAGDNVEKRLLLGSESSGKFRYDAGVETGTITITFRSKDGKMIGKLSSDFHLQTGVSELTSVDGIFKYTLNTAPKNVYFVTMKTYAEPVAASAAWQNGYGVFASDGKAHPGKIASE